MLIAKPVVAGVVARRDDRVVLNRGQGGNTPDLIHEEARAAPLASSSVIADSVRMAHVAVRSHRTMNVMQIQIHNLTKVYNEQRGLLPASLEVEKGELIAVIGHNGAGKSTLLKMLASWLLPDSGHVLVDGINLKNRMEVVRKVGFVPETPNLFDFFSVQYNLKLFARFFQVPFLRIEEIMKEFDLLPFRKNKIQILSKGLRQRVSIGRALLADPPVLLFDEPTSGIDFDMTKEIYRLLKDFHTSGKTIIFTSHRPEEIKTLATRIIVLHQGSLVFDGSTQQYFQSEIHEKLYL